MRRCEEDGMIDEGCVSFHRCPGTSGTGKDGPTAALPAEGAPATLSAASSSGPTAPPTAPPPPPPVSLPGNLPLPP